MSGVPQGSVLGPLLFLIYINDIDEGVASKLLKFADDSKIFNKVRDNIDSNVIQSDLHKLYKWSEDWQMLFNIEKCVVLHMGGKHNENFVYELGGKSLKSVEKERDLGVIIHKNCKASEQCTTAVNKANQILGMIKRNIKFKNKNTIIRLYKALVRPRLEYCVQAWNPNFVKDIELLEGVQRRATKIIEGFSNLSYEERLKRANLTTLTKRRVRGDLIETFKILKGIEKIDYNKFFTLANNEKNVRGHSLKLEKKRCNSDVRKHFFSQRVVNNWNRLPEIVIEANSVNNFKNRLDECKY